VGGADVLLNLDIAFNAVNLNFTINGNSFVPPTVPVLLQILSGAELATDLLPSGSMYVLPPNSVVELSMPAGAGGGSHAFDVVRSAGQTAYNYANPPRRDVISLGASGDNVTIRWTTDNAGPWYLHCHIDWHLQLGLAIVFAE
ncbi:multicopper oxidase, partial [Athelia psychrophila]